MSVQNLQFDYGESIVCFTLKRRKRKTLSITVKPDGCVDVTAPLDVALEKIFEKIRKRTPWILKQVRYFAQFQPRTTARKYIGGETHLYLGRQYKLKVVPHIQERIKVFPGRIVVQSLKPRRSEVTKNIVEAWYRERAHAKFREWLTRCLEKFPRPEDFQPSGLIIRKLEKRWGSMTGSGRLILNVSLIRASVDAIDYVITHELCHLRHPNHGAEFFRLLSRVMPDWQKRKVRLELQLA